MALWTPPVVPHYIVTSSSRPTPVLGLAIYEIDTNRFLIFNGVDWTPPWNLPWGIVAEGSGGPTLGHGSAPFRTGLSVPFTSVKNRKYKITYTDAVRGYSAGAAASNVTLQINVDGVGVGIPTNQDTPNQQDYYNVCLVAVVAPDPGNHAVTANVTVNTNFVDFLNAHVVVEDVGPAGDPA